jgi:hypothetical protein
VQSITNLSVDFFFVGPVFFALRTCTQSAAPSRFREWDSDPEKKSLVLVQRRCLCAPNGTGQGNAQVPWFVEKTGSEFPRF